MSRAAPLFTALFVAPLLTLAGQDSRPVVPGDYLRLTTNRSEQRILGTLVSWSNGSLSIKGAASTSIITISEREISNVQVRRQNGSYAESGVAIGTLVGAVFGASAGSRSRPACSGFLSTLCRDSQRFALALVGGVIGVSAGAVVGAAVGSAFHHHVWEQVAATHLQVRIGPRAAGLGLAFEL